MTVGNQVSASAVCALLRNVIDGVTSREDAADAARLALDGAGAGDRSSTQALAIVAVCDRRDDTGAHLLTSGHLRAWLKDLEREPQPVGSDGETAPVRGGAGWLARANR